MRQIQNVRQFTRQQSWTLGKVKVTWKRKKTKWGIRNWLVLLREDYAFRDTATKCGITCVNPGWIMMWQQTNSYQSYAVTTGKCDRWSSTREQITVTCYGWWCNYSNAEKCLILRRCVIQNLSPDVCDSLKRFSKNLKSLSRDETNTVNASC